VSGDPDLALPEWALVGLLEDAERALALCEPLRFGHGDAGIRLWIKARVLVRRLSAELLSRVDGDLDELGL
jgi:hypothetical protein